MSVKRHLLLLAPLMLVAPGAVAANYQGSLTTLYSFTGGADGGTPNAPLALDSFQDLFGTAQAGGVNCEQIGVHGGCGTLYELNAQGTVFRVGMRLPERQMAESPWPARSCFDGKLYGTALQRGNAHDDGVIYAAQSPTGRTSRSCTVLHAPSTARNPQYPGCCPSPAGGLVWHFTAMAVSVNDPANITTPPMARCSCGNRLDTCCLPCIHFHRQARMAAYPSALVEDTSGNLYGSTIRRWIVQL